MFDSIIPYDIKFVQKASPATRDAFQFLLVYRFFSESFLNHQRLKYIIRVEAIKGDIFALKFYAARDRKLEDKYHRIIKAYRYRETLRIFITCASLIPELLKEYPKASFIINGAQSHDMESNKIEGRESTQRFRIYRYTASTVIGKKTFEHFEFPEISSYLLVNRKDTQDIESEKERIKNVLLDLYDINL